MFKKIQKNKNIILLIVLFCGVFGLFFGIRPVLAAANPVMVGIVTVIGWIAFLLSYVIGYIATVAIDVLIWVAQFNNIIGVDAVVKGWVIVRDLSNMFFILILLVIAFATILRLPNYEWKKLLPKLLIMAVLINFSKTICGLIIDFSQVIMLTFVNGFAETGTGHFVAMFKMETYGSLTGVKDLANEQGSGMAVAAGIIMGVFAMLVSVIVILVMLGVLVMRIIMLWVYTILSPIAFLAAAFPAGQKYASQWWGEFSKNVIIGPVLAFFIWLALLTAGTSSDNLSVSVGMLDAKTGNTISGVKSEVVSPNALFSTRNFQSYIITLALLIGGLMVTQQIGGMAASIAGKGMAAVQKSGAGILKGARIAGSYGLDKASQFTGGRVDFNLGRTWSKFKGEMAENKAERGAGIEANVAAKAKEGNRLAMLTHGGLAARNLSSWDGIKGFAMGRGRNKYNNKAEELEKERKSVITSKERSGLNRTLSDKNIRLNELNHEIHNQEAATVAHPTNENVEKLKSLKQEKIGLAKEIKNVKTDIGSKIVDDKKAKDIDVKIGENRNLAQKYAFQGDDIVENARAQTISTQEKKITHIDNADKLGEIMKGAIKGGNQGLIAAVARKMTKQGDYNELARVMKVGTGTKGMQDLAKKFRTDGRMSEQSSRGLVAEMGVMCKNLGQFGGFASMMMDKSGNWREATEDESQIYQLAEMLKMEPQRFVTSTNRLGVGYYDDPSGQGKQDASTWKMSKAATAYIFQNQAGLETQLVQRGMQNLIEHLSIGIPQLVANGVKSGTGSVVDIINNRSNKGGTDVASTIKNVKT
ncbi:MAG: hypothetical protein Q8O93_00400 [bacterium]|nr:hypothetical protein [bacterium]